MSSNSTIRLACMLVSKFCFIPYSDQPSSTFLTLSLCSIEIQGSLGAVKHTRANLYRRVQLEDYFTNHSDPPQSRLPNSQTRNSTSPLLPSAELRESPQNEIERDSTLKSPAEIAAEIERPRSALHSGDFREGSPHHQDERQTSDILDDRSERNFHRPLASSPTTPWYTPGSSVPGFGHFQHGSRYSQTCSEDVLPRSRAPSTGSLSSSFVLKAPTSPLVQQSNNTDLDISPRAEPMNLSTSPDRNSRRRTLPPETFRSFQSSPLSQPQTPNFSRPLSGLRREGSNPSPYQAHQPRRSLTSAYSMQITSSPQTPAFLRSRRPSYSSDVSPLQHASMVGSYEESILRGRMSTTPSKPLDFTAQIGVLGKGNCKPNLRCPAHVTVPFPAVFYSYATVRGRRSSISEDNPSPYVGLIDIENSLKPDESKIQKRRRRHGSSSDHESQGDDGCTAHIDRRKLEKKLRRSQSPKMPPGGCYRIPQCGQLQIVIKNPNKTAVKLFLVPYDLEGMEPGTKTFIRQRSYSAGPIIDMPLTTRNNLGTDGPKAALNTSEDPKDKPVLRYLIHLNICCPSRGRFYLHSSIRVVFANRVPDGKEKLKNETQMPEPRYSIYKPVKDPTMGSAGAKLAAEKAFRRRSSGFAITPGGYDVMDGVGVGFTGSTTFPHHVPTPALPTTPIPFHVAPRSRKETRSLFEKDYVEDENMAMDVDSAPQLHTSPPAKPPPSSMPNGFNTMPFPSTPPSLSQPGLLQSLTSPVLSNSSYRSMFSNGSDGYNKLNKGDIGYGGNAFGFSSTGGEAGEGLLARRLKGLDVQRKEDEDRGFV